MKKLSKEEMKKVMGGVLAPPDDPFCPPNKIIMHQWTCGFAGHSSWFNGPCPSSSDYKWTCPDPEAIPYCINGCY